MSENDEWEAVTNNRKLLHYLNKQRFLCGCGCGYHFKIDDKVNKKSWVYPNYPHLAHKFERSINFPRPDLKKDINCVMRLECHAKQHNYKYGWMKKFKEESK